MNKKTRKQSDITKMISKKTSIKYETVRNVLRSLTVFVGLALENDENVTLGIGKFSLKTHKAREVMNFQTKERYINNPKTKIIYTPSVYMQKVGRRKDFRALEAQQLEKEENNAN